MTKADDNAIVLIVVETMKPASLTNFTRRINLSNADYDFSALVEPSADLDSTFKCYDTDEKEWLFVQGWKFDISVDSGARDNGTESERRAFGMDL